MLTAVLPANPTTTFVVVLPIPTAFAASKYLDFDNSKFLFSIFFVTSYVNSVSSRVINVPEECDAIEVEL